MANSASDKVKTSVGDSLHNTILTTLQSKLPLILKAAEESYTLAFYSVNVDSKSLSNPENFLEDFKDVVSKFKYFAEGDELALHLPNEDTFDFSGKLSVLKFIVEGIVGNFIELPETDLITILNTLDLRDQIKTILVGLPGVEGTDIAPELRFKLVPLESTLSTIFDSILGKELIKFPFSNTPPIDIFEYLHNYVDYNISSWIEEGVNKAITQTIQG